MDFDDDLPSARDENPFRDHRPPNVVGYWTNLTRKARSLPCSIWATDLGEEFPGVQRDPGHVAVFQHPHHCRTFGAEELLLIVTNGLVDLVYEATELLVHVTGSSQSS